MFIYYITSAFKNLYRNGIFSAINIFGFAFSISVCLAIATFLVHEYSYDSYHKNANYIYRLSDPKNNSCDIDYRIKDILKDNYPEIKNACLVQLLSYPIHYQSNEKGYYIDNAMSCDNAFFDIFSVKIIKKKSEKLFVDKNSVVITESAARTLFGYHEPIGKELLGFDSQLIVSAVVEDFPDNSSIQANVIVNAENDNFKFSFSCDDYRDKSSHRWPFGIYLQMNENAETEDFADKINSKKKVLAPYIENVGLIKLDKLYLNDSSIYLDNLKGSPNLIIILKSIAIIILLLALINYINLTVSQIYKRGKEIGIKKTTGANQKNIIVQFIVEAFMIIGFSMLLSLLFFPFSQAFYKTLFYPTFNISILLQARYTLYLLLALLVLSGVSGYVNAILFAKASPLKIISNKVLTIGGRRKYMQNALTTFQFIVSIALIFSVIVIHKQINFVKHKNLGFKQEQLLNLNMPSREKEESKTGLLMEKLQKYPDIISMSATNGVPGEINSTMGANQEGIKGYLSIINADTFFLETFKVKLKRGRYLKPGEYGEVCLFNEEAFKLFKWNDLENKKYNNGREEGYDVIGVVENFHFNSLHKQIEPLAILFSAGYESHLNIRLAPNNIGHSIENIQKAWDEVYPGYVMKYQFYDAWFNNMYESEERFAKSISLFAFLAIIISSLGILGLSIFTIAGRIKEIGIRKVNGAKNIEIALMLSNEILKWVTIAFIIACPIAWYAMHKWLENFAYKTELSWWIFALAGFLAFVVALLTVSWQSWRAAARNPVESLRYE